MKTREPIRANAPEEKITCIAPRKIRLKLSSAIISSFKNKGKWLSPLAFAAIMCSCNNSDQLVQQYKELHEHDSLLSVKSQSEDSTIKGYISSMNEIQSNLDEIKSREKILSVQGNGEMGNTNHAVADIKALDNLIIKSNKEIAALHSQMKKLGVKDAGLEKIVAHMSAEISEKDSEIAVIQGNLAKLNNSYTEVTRQFNDSIVVLQAQNNRIENMTNSMNTVYYAIGTLKELKDNKVITKTGGFIGIGKNTELTPDQNTSYFTKTDLTKLNVIPLNAKFKKLLTTHPAMSYKIEGDKKVDSLLITDAAAFWSEDKYLVVAVK